MKKISVLIPLILILAMLFCSCSVAEESFIEPFWNNYEKFSYNVYEGETKKGTMTSEVKKVYSESVVFETGKTVEEASGSLLTYNLILDNGDYVKSKVLLKTNFQPVYSERYFKRGETETVSYCSYENNYCNYTITENGNTVSDRIKIKSLYCDNEIIYLMVRAARLENSDFSSITFNTADIKAGELKKLICTKSSTVDIVNGYNDTAKCITVLISVSGEKGTPLYAYYSSEEIDANGVKVLKAPVQIKEGNYTYTLCGIEATA